MPLYISLEEYEERIGRRKKQEGEVVDPTEPLEEPKPREPKPGTAAFYASQGLSLEDPTYLSRPIDAPERRGGVAPEDRPGFVEQARGDVARGVDNLQALGYGAAALAADAVGAEGLRDKAMEGYQRNREEAAKNPAVIGSYENIRTDEGVGALAEDTARYVIEAVGENLPTMLPSLVTGGLAGVGAKKLLEKGAQKAIEAQVRKGVAREAAEKAVASTINRQIGMAAAAGAFPSSATIESGGIFTDIYEETGRFEPDIAAGYGAVAGALDALPVGLIGSKAFKVRLGKQLADGIVRRYGTAGLGQFLSEGSTEALQTIVEKAAVNQADPSYDIWSDENVVEVIDSFLKGGLAGGVVGLAGQGVQDLRTGASRETQAAEAAPATTEDAETQGALADTEAPAPGESDGSPVRGEAPASPRQGEALELPPEALVDVDEDAEGVGATPVSDPGEAQSEAERNLLKPTDLTATDRYEAIGEELASLPPGPESQARRQELLQERASIEETAGFPDLVVGKPSRAQTESGVDIDVDYAVVSADDLIASHTTDLRPNPQYPPELQPRDRERAASEVQIANIAQKLNPARLAESPDTANGAPIIGRDGLVESGNARTIALKRVYDADGAKAREYRQWLLENAERLGIEPSAVEGTAKPVLVRVRKTRVNRAEFARQSNAPTTATMSATEQARADRARVGNLDGLTITDTGEIEPMRNQPFIRRFIGGLPATEQAALVTSDGRLSATGQRRINNAILAFAYGDSPTLERLTESLDDNLRNVTKALLKVAPTVAKARESIRAGAMHDADIADNILDAVEMLAGIKDSGRSIAEVLAQSEMFERVPSETGEMLEFLAANIRSPKKIAAFIEAYYEALGASGSPAQGSLIESERPSKRRVIQVAKERSDGLQRQVQGREDEAPGEPGPDEDQEQDGGPAPDRRAAEDQGAPVAEPAEGGEEGDQGGAGEGQRVAEPGVEARRQAYNPDQLPLDFEKVYEQAETRPGTTEKQRSLGIQALRALWIRDRRAGATVLGSALWRDFQEHKGVELIGQRVRNARDLARAAQILRDPRFETLRYFLVKGDEIVGYSGVTSRLPGTVDFKTPENMGRVMREIEDEMKRLGADGYWMLHNHPSGNPMPSGADQMMTRSWAGSIRGFRGHVIIDQYAYGYIDDDGVPDIRPLATATHEPELPHDLIKRKIGGPEDFAKAARELKRRDGFDVLISVDHQMQIMAIAEVPSHLLRPTGGPARVKALARVRRFTRMTGSYKSFVVTDKPDDLAFLIGNDLVFDVISWDDESRSLANNVMPGLSRAPKAGFLRAEQSDGEYRKRIAEQVARFKGVYERDGAVELKHRTKGKFVAVMPDATEQGKIRIQPYDKFGMPAHETRDTVDEALREVVEDGFTEPAKGSVDRLAARPEWKLGFGVRQEGVKYLNEVREAQQKYPLAPEEFEALDQLMDDAYQRHASYEKMVRGIAKDLGVDALVPAVKRRIRTHQKILADYKGKVGRNVRDLLRSTLVVDSIEDARRVFDDLVARFDPQDILKSRFTLDPDSNAGPDGYRDGLIHVLWDGFPVEIQVNQRDMLAAKERGHKVYENLRDMVSEAQIAGVPLTADQLAQVNKMNRDSAAIYAEVWDRLSASSRKRSSVTSTPSEAMKKVEEGREPSASKAVATPSGVSTTGSGSIESPQSKYLVPGGKLSGSFIANPIIANNPRLPKETDSEYAKRVLSQVPPPDGLEDRPASYFSRPRGTKMVPVADLHGANVGARRDNAARRLAAAAGGLIAKRDPLHVIARPEGGFEVLDGNATLAAAFTYGWRTLPVLEVKAHEGVYYFPSYTSAKVYADRHGHPTDRIVQVERGYAIQLEKGGAYVGPVAVEQPRLGYSTESEAFKRWFGKSKAVDKDGKPLVVYHGTGADFTEFAGGHSFFTSRRSVAKKYAERVGSDRVMAVYLKMENPLEVDAAGDTWDTVNVGGMKLSPQELRKIFGAVKSEYTTGEIAEAASKAGYDGVIFRDLKDSPMGRNVRSDVFVVFSSNQVKSADGNLGTFDPADANILREPRATYGDQDRRTPEFRRWFKGSKVVDAKGEPLQVYHGSLADFSVFDEGKLGTATGAKSSALGFFFTDNHLVAGRFARFEDGRIMPVYLNIKNPFEIGFRTVDERKRSAKDPFTALQDAITKTAGKAKWDDVTTEDVKAWRGKLREHGFDGVIVRNTAMDANPRSIKAPYHDFYIAFESNQIKSVFNQRPTSDPNILRQPASAYAPQILPQRRRPAQPGNRASWTVDEPGKLDRFIRALQDKHIDTKRVLQAIRKQVGQLKDSLDVYLQEELFHGRTAKRAHDFMDNEMRPLLVEMGARGVSMKDLEAYLHARHAEERNVQIAKVNPDMPDGGSGMTTAAARKYLNGLGAKRKTLEALAKRVDLINAETRRLMIAYGLESPQTIAAWEEAYKHYVPLQREDLETPGIGQGFSVRGDIAKRAVGSKRAVVDILANIAMQRERVIVRGEKNRVATALYGLAKLAPNKDFWDTDKPRKIKYIDDRTGLVVERPDPMFKMRENVVVARIPDSKGNVVERAVVFREDNERAMSMVQALKNLDAHDLGEVLSLGAKVTRYVAAMNTAYNPVFGVVNFTRDVQGALLNLTSTALRGKQSEVLKNTMSALRGIYVDQRASRKGGQPTSQWASLWEEFQKEGGQTGYRDMFATSKDRAEALEKEVRTGKRTIGQRGVLGWLRDYNDAMENAVRLAAYKVGLDNGLSKQRAASVAKNLTVNFNRRGSYGTQAGALYAFFNASMQGTARIVETARGPAGKRIVLGGVLLGSIQALALAAAGFDDEDIPEFVKERNLIVPIGGKKYITIPMPLGYHAIPNIGRIATELALNEFRETPKRASQFINILLDAFNPIGTAGSFVQTIAPTIADPFVALAENRDWTGRPIYREDFSSLSPTPGHSRKKDSATWFGDMVSRALNAISGGTEYTPGVFSPTPDQIDYVIGEALGGLGRESAKAWTTGEALLTAEELPPYKIPLVGRFYGSASGPHAQGSAFYENIRTINIHEAEVKGRRRAGEPVDEYFERYPEARLAAAANRAERQVRQLRQQVRRLKEADAPREQIQAVEDRITAAMRDLNERVKAVRER